MTLINTEVLEMRSIVRIVGNQYLERLDKAIKYLRRDTSPERLILRALLVALTILTSLTLFFYITMGLSSVTLLVPPALSYLVFKAICDEPLSAARSKSVIMLRRLLPVLEEAVERYANGEISLTDVALRLADSEERLLLLKGTPPERILREIANREYSETVARALRVLALLHEIDPSLIDRYKQIIRDLLIEARRALILEIERAETYATVLTVVGFFMPLIMALAISFGILSLEYLPLIIPAYLLLMTLITSPARVHTYEG